MRIQKGEKVFLESFPAKVPDKLLLFLCFGEQAPRGGVGDRGAGWSGGPGDPGSCPGRGPKARLGSDGVASGKSPAMGSSAPRRKRLCLRDLNDMFIDFSGAVHS